MHIYLIRHGRQDTILCNDDVGLAKEGREQARILGQRMINYGVDALYASTLIRAKETAQIIKEELIKAGKFTKEQPIELRRDLREIDFGTLEGYKNEEIPILFKDFVKRRDDMTEDLAFPEGECGQQVWERSIKVLQEIVESKYKKVAVVTHGGVIRSLLSGILGMDQANKLLFCKDLENCSITELYYRQDRNRLYVERINDYAHIENSPHLLRDGWI